MRESIMIIRCVLVPANTTFNRNASVALAPSGWRWETGDGTAKQTLLARASLDASRWLNRGEWR